MRGVNIGCGRTPTPGWRNYDNSFSLRLARVPLLTRLMSGLGLLDRAQREFIEFAARSDVGWADATRRIPEGDRSVDVLYSSHMFEHLDRDDAALFLAEARRVLRQGGIIRLAVPNIRYHVEAYLESGDADTFVERTKLARPRARGLVGKLKELTVGPRNHQWMYDGDSLGRFLESAGFRNPRVLESGQTTIPSSGELDLSERAPESVFVEADNP